MRKSIPVAICLMWAIALCAQVVPPKHESHWHHLFIAHRDQDNLESRYQQLRCALVVVQSGNSIGTGFYINANGDLATASHVLGPKTITSIPNGFSITINHAENIAIKGVNGETIFPAKDILDANADNWAVDLAILRTHRASPCWLKIGNDHLARAGQHVLTLGFPGLAFGSLTMYTGIISAKLKSDLVVGMTTTNQPLKFSGDLLRVQMPISPGISGAPIIDDENRVLGIVTSAGAWGPDLEVLTQIQRMREAAPPQPGPPNTLDLVAVTAHLAEIYHDFGSPGYGDAVPMSYLQLTKTQSSQTPSPPVH